MSKGNTKGKSSKRTRKLLGFEKQKKPRGNRKLEITLQKKFRILVPELHYQVYYVDVAKNLKEAKKKYEQGNIRFSTVKEDQWFVRTLEPEEGFEPQFEEDSV